MSGNFYRLFEEKHRGSIEEIKSRLSVYLSSIITLAKIYPNYDIVDLGCGRGEWLELLKENNLPAVGVDLNDGMLERALQIGLNVKKIDCLQFLKSLEDESIMAITAFHIAEHLSFEMLQLLIKESLRVLKPGGLLILETPNPENVSVGTCSFYMDPTHIHPLPPALLEFVSNYYGFQRTKIMRLQEKPKLRDFDEPINLVEVLKGVSPDYSLVAQKHADESITLPLNPYFDKEYGVTLDELCIRYDQGLDVQFRQLKNELISITSKLDELENQLQNKRKRALSTRIRNAVQFLLSIPRRSYNLLKLISSFSN